MLTKFTQFAFSLAHLEILFCAIIKHMASPEQRSLRGKEALQTVGSSIGLCLSAATADSMVSLRAHLLCSMCDNIAFKCHLNPPSHS